jgi:hypothetical protein
MTGLEACANASTPCALSSALLMDGCRGFGLKGGMNSPLNSPVKFFAVTVIAVARCPSPPPPRASRPTRTRMKRSYRTGWRTWKGPEQGRSAGRPPRACSKEPLNLAVVVSFRHALSVASLPRLRFVRLVGGPASRMSRATVSASSTLDSMSRLSAPCARVSFEAAKYCEVPAMRPVAPRRSCTNFPSAHGIAPEAIVCASLR